MRAITINTDLCHKDGICAMVCPARHIQAKVGDIPVGRKGDATACIGCGQCMAFCPHSAIHVEGLDTEQQQIKRADLPSPQATSLLLRSRRSIRMFKEQPVPKELITSLIHDASYAPTAKNMRELRYIVLYEQEKMKAFGDCLASCYKKAIEEQPDSSFAPLYKMLAMSWRNGTDIIFRKAPHLALVVADESGHWPAVDSAISLTYLEIAANANGVGACWAGFVTSTVNNFPETRAMLGLKENEVVFGGQMLGFPKIFPRATAPRASYEIAWI